MITLRNYIIRSHTTARSSRQQLETNDKPHPHLRASHSPYSPTPSSLRNSNGNKVLCSKYCTANGPSIAMMDALVLEEYGSPHEPASCKIGWKQIPKPVSVEQSFEVGMKDGKYEGILGRPGILEGPQIFEEGDVLVRVHAASINALDLRIRDGYGKALFETQRPLPIVMGRDMAGEIIACGNGVWDLRVGQRVCGASWPWAALGTFSTYSVINQNHVAKIPINVDDKSAAAISFSGVTAYHALFMFTKQCKPFKSKIDKMISGTIENVKPAKKPYFSSTDSNLELETVNDKIALVHGGAGAVGSVACQLLKLMGYKVIASCKDDLDHKYLSNIVDQVILLDNNSLIDENSSTGWRGLNFGTLDLVVDCVGGSLENSRMIEELSLRLLKENAGAEFVTTSGRAIITFDSAYQNQAYTSTESYEQRDLEANNQKTNDQSQNPWSIFGSLASTVIKQVPHILSVVGSAVLPESVKDIGAASAQSAAVFLERQTQFSSRGIGYQWAYFWPNQDALCELLALMEIGALSPRIGLVVDAKQRWTETPLNPSYKAESIEEDKDSNNFSSIGGGKVVLSFEEPKL